MKKKTTKWGKILEILDFYVFRLRALQDFPFIYLSLCFLFSFSKECMNNVHPIYNIKRLMLKQQLSKDPKLAEENWDRFLPQFKKTHQPKKKKKIYPERERAVFPPPPQPRKEDIAMLSGQAFFEEDRKKPNKRKKKIEDDESDDDGENETKNVSKKRERSRSPSSVQTRVYKNFDEEQVMEEEPVQKHLKGEPEKGKMHKDKKKKKKKKKSKKSKK
jgi:ribosomal RNA assembly protein